MFVWEPRSPEARRSLVLEIWRNFQKFRSLISPTLYTRCTTALKYSFKVDRAIQHGEACSSILMELGYAEQKQPFTAFCPNWNRA
ncbi:hypothetical protein AVEN_118598-1 [Araneus ventricosus]|uniref:Uncharacterized protein n=1 Tax=Araneus ventricosus TaxID=182803 RepID=A0A4Y2AXD3_ARAVE|nr:hypothetical protein AVEN_118598-1 [Araneus ventricosus]